MWVSPVKGDVVDELPAARGGAAVGPRRTSGDRARSRDRSPTVSARAVDVPGPGRSLIARTAARAGPSPGADRQRGRSARRSRRETAHAISGRRRRDRRFPRCPSGRAGGRVQALHVEELVLDQRDARAGRHLVLGHRAVEDAAALVEHELLAQREPDARAMPPCNLGRHDVRIQRPTDVLGRGPVDTNRDLAGLGVDVDDRDPSRSTCKFAAKLPRPVSVRHLGWRRRSRRSPRRGRLVARSAARHGRNA